MNINHMMIEEILRTQTPQTELEKVLFARFDSSIQEAFESAFDIADMEAVHNTYADLVATVIDVLQYREGKLPTLGYLRDNDKSRAALERLAKLVGVTP